VQNVRPFLVVYEKGAALLGGPLLGNEGDDFWGGADLNEPSYGQPFVSATMPRSLTLSPVDVSGFKNLKMSILLAGSDVDFDAPDFLRIKADPDGEGELPAVVLAEFIEYPGGTPNRGAMGDRLDGQARPLRPQFKEFTYNLPADSTSLVIRFEGISTFFNEVYAFDNIRITGDTKASTPTISIARTGQNVVLTFEGVLQSSATPEGPYGDVQGATSPRVLAPAQQQAQRYYRSRNP